MATYRQPRSSTRSARGVVVGTAGAALTPAFGAGLACAAPSFLVAAGAVLVAALGGSGLLALTSGCRSGRGVVAPDEPEREESRGGAEARADQAADEHVNRKMHAQVDAREGDARGEDQGP